MFTSVHVAGTVALMAQCMLNVHVSMLTKTSYAPEAVKAGVGEVRAHAPMVTDSS